MFDPRSLDAVDPALAAALRAELMRQERHRVHRKIEHACKGGRLLAMGGGYNRHNLARAWTRVVEELAS